MNKLIKDMTGKRFTRLLVIERAPSDSNGNARWHCICDCGSKTISSGFTLRNGEAKSCGCLTTEQLIGRITKHEMVGTPEYLSWGSMIQRCCNPKCRGYASYGGRGIKVCDRWFDFRNFYADMGARPGKDYSIDRIDNNGDYTPENCRWATDAEQRRNTRANVYVIHDGVKMTLQDACAAAGINRNTVEDRVRRGWSMEDALALPVGSRRP